MTPAYDREGHEVTTADVECPPRDCDDCEGAGTCGNCGGCGTIVGRYIPEVRHCRECKGSGECATCDGRGHLT